MFIGIGVGITPKGVGSSAPAIIYPEIYPQPEFDASIGLTVGASWTITGGEAVNSGASSSLDGLLSEAIVPGASYRLEVTLTGFPDDVSAILVGVSDQIVATTNGGQSPRTVDFVASANANTSLRFLNIDGGAGALQSVSLKRTA